MSSAEITSLIDIIQIVSVLETDLQQQIEKIKKNWQIFSVQVCEDTSNTSQKIIPKVNNLKFKTIIYLANDDNSFYRVVFIYYLINLFAHGQQQQIENFIRTIYQFIESNQENIQLYQQLQELDQIFKSSAVRFIAFLNKWRQQEKQNVISDILNDFSTQNILDFITVVICKKLFLVCFEKSGLLEIFEGQDKCKQKEEIEKNLLELERKINFQIVSLASETFQSNIDIYFVDGGQFKETLTFTPFVNQVKEDNKINILFSNGNNYILLEKDIKRLSLEKFDRRTLENQMIYLSSIQQQQSDDFSQSQKLDTCKGCNKIKQCLYIEYQYRCQDCINTYYYQKQEVQQINQDNQQLLQNENKKMYEMFKQAAYIIQRKQSQPQQVFNQANQVHSQNINNFDNQNPYQQINNMQYSGTYFFPQQQPQQQQQSQPQQQQQQREQSRQVPQQYQQIQQQYQQNQYQQQIQNQQLNQQGQAQRYYQNQGPNQLMNRLQEQEQHQKFNQPLQQNNNNFQFQRQAHQIQGQNQQYYQQQGIQQQRQNQNYQSYQQRPQQNQPQNQQNCFNQQQQIQNQAYNPFNPQPNQQNQVLSNIPGQQHQFYFAKNVKEASFQQKQFKITNQGNNQQN